MAESKFTPGPWVVEKPEAYKDTWRITADGQRLASLDSEDGDPEETKANAEPMADAPRMLEVLRTLCDHFNRPHQYDVGTQIKAFGDAHDLLEKHGG